MPLKKHDRQYDLVVFGATGYTGALTTEHVASHLPSNLNWAVAGRSASKLQTLVEDCKRLSADRLQPHIEICNLDAAELDALAKKTYLLIAAVGPFSRFGEYAFRACAENGTHYLDITGELPWTARMIQKFETVAKRTGAIMIPQAAIESAPSDLCSWMLAKTLRTELSAQTADVTISVRINASPSGGTLASALTVFDVFSLQELRRSHKPFALSPVPHPYRPVRLTSLITKLTGLRTIPGLGLNTTSIANRTDGSLVERSWGLIAETPSRKHEFYGPKFSFTQYMKARNWRHGMALHYGLIVVGFLVATLPPFRRLLQRLVTQPGDGPEKEASRRDVIEYRGIAKPDADDSKMDKRAYCQARFLGSMYYLSGVLVSQAAHTILEDDLRLGGGIYTPACLGQGLIDRLATAGFKIDTSIIDAQGLNSSSAH